MLNIREDRWSTAEDDVIRQAVKKYGSNQWDRVASLLSRKSAAQCRARWYEVLNPRLSHGEWTKEEDLLLLELANRLPNMWRSIGATLGSRSAGQCHERFETLNQRGTLEVDKPGGVAGSMDPAAEKDMVTEANARMTSSLGRKAKRKKRERIEDEAKFLKMMEENRVRLKRGLESVQVEPPVSTAAAISPGPSDPSDLSAPAIPHTTTKSDTRLGTRTISDTRADTGLNTRSVRGGTGLNTHSDTGTVGSTSYKPNTKPGTSTPDRRDRPKLALSPPSHSTTKQHPLQHITVSTRVTAKLTKRLDAMPKPTNV